MQCGGAWASNPARGPLSRLDFFFFENRFYFDDWAWIQHSVLLVATANVYCKETIDKMVLKSVCNEHEY
jgi:hypothetical protein